MDAENEKIRSELKFWNDVYAHDTSVSAPPDTASLEPSSAFLMPIPMPSLSLSVPVAQTTPAMSMPPPYYGKFAFTMSPPSLGYSSFAPEIHNLGIGR